LSYFSSFFSKLNVNINSKLIKSKFRKGGGWGRTKPRADDRTDGMYGATGSDGDNYTGNGGARGNRRGNKV